MTITIEEAKAFIEDAKKARANWLSMAERSWDEIKKLQKNGRLWSVTPSSMKKRSKYPAWYSIFKIRQPLLLSRVGIPIGKDTTQDGNDNIGATAAICLERLAVNLARSFNFFDVMCSARDDFLATCFGMVRAYYERDEIKERVKERITPQQDEMTGEIVFIDSMGETVETDEIYQDDEGYYLEHEEVVAVDNEKVCLEPVLYRDVYIDPDIRRFNRCKRLAFCEHYSVPEFKHIFGTQAYLDLSNPDKENVGASEAAPKRQSIKVYEYWDEYEEECLWWAENGTKFIKPKDYYMPNNEEMLEGEKLNGLYNLEKFFPCPAPLITNQSTDEFWPVPEYYQLIEIFEDIHTIFSRMITLTRAIRTRLLFDNNVEGLQEALNEASEADAFGVPNLGQSLVSAGGSLDAVVQYIPVEKLIQGLGQMYDALEQRLNIVYKLTGTSDLLQGLVTDPTQRTLGERQMTEKYALNQIAEPQRKMQEFVRDGYQLICEMALKNFKDESLDRYIMPSTLAPDHKERYKAAMGMLKQDQKRFRIELETDSTIALNEDYDKKMRVELVTSLTAGLEKCAAIAESSPALIVPELHALKYLIQGFRQGKMFQNEITMSIDNVIKQAEAAKMTPPFNKEQADNELSKQRLQLETNKAQMEFQLEGARFQMEQQKTQAEAQLATFKAQLESYRAQNDTAYKSEQLAIEKQIKSIEGQIAIYTFQLEREKAGVEIQNKMADNARLEAVAAADIQNPDRGTSNQPQIIMIPSAPQPPAAPIIIAPPQSPGPTIINAPNPTPQTNVIQPVQQVPVPMAPPPGFIPPGSGMI